MKLSEQNDARLRIAHLRRNLRDVAYHVNKGRPQDIDPEVVIELRGDLEQLLEACGRADG